MRVKKGGVLRHRLAYAERFHPRHHISSWWEDNRRTANMTPLKREVQLIGLKSIMRHEKPAG